MTDGPAVTPPDRAARFWLGRLAGGAGLVAGCVAGLLGAWSAGWLDGVGRIAAIVRTAAQTGAAGLVLAPMLLMAGAALTCRLSLGPSGGTAVLGRWRRVPVPALGLHWPMAACTVLALIASLVLRPQEGAPGAGDAAILAACLLALAFPALVAERALAGARPAALADAPALRALALLAVLALAVGAVVALAVGMAQDWALWVASVASGLVTVVAAELLARALGQCFLPPARRRAPVRSLAASVIAGSLGRGGIAAPIRASLGIDFSRSWALTFLRAAAMPALVLTALLCWALSGLVALPADRRAVVERLGAPVGVLGPGLHAILPWPLGRTRTVEFGVVHDMVLGAGARAAPDTLAAEASPPASADRLWERAHPGEASYLIASATEGRQGVQTVSADLRVLWRVGMQDADARRAAYATADPEALVRAATGRQLARFFAASTLDAVLDERREAIAETLARAIGRELDALGSGVELLGVVIEAVHPPAGAAVAYHAVQAARIAAATSVASERGRARGAANQARQEAQRLATGATATAAETVALATGDAVRFASDHMAAEAGEPAFLLERYLDVVARALARAPLTLMDHRLDAASAPLLDLRPLARAATPAADED